MPSTYLLVAAVVACLSAWFGLNYLQPFTLNTLRLQRLFATTPAISFYKLSLQWPPSTCNGAKTIFTCKPPTLHKFTIHGIWPQDKDDEPVPAYNRSNPCTNERPTSDRDLPDKLKPILTDLKSLWPNLEDPESLTVNFEFWKKEWRRHGTCSDYPNQPLLYFKSALQLRNGLDGVMGLTIGSSYTAQDVADRVKSNVGAYPEIACNRNRVTNALQLWEIRLCYKRPTPPELPQTIKNCRRKFSGCRGPDRITFPSYLASAPPFYKIFE